MPLEVWELWEPPVVPEDEVVTTTSSSSSSSVPLLFWLELEFIVIEDDSNPLPLSMALVVASTAVDFDVV